jgi:hypothetical protein
MITRILNRHYIYIYILVVFFSIVAVLLAYLFPNTSKRVRKEDIYYTWVEGDRIINGINPYSRIHGSDMKNNRKYATYFPGFYFLSSASQKLGLNDFNTWVKLWRSIFFISYIATGLVIFIQIIRRGFFVLAMLAIVYWLFNRWSIKVISIAHLEPLAIFLLMVSLSIYKDFRRTSLLLLGCSLAIKQIGVFIIPIYIVLEMSDRKGAAALKRGGAALAWILVVPALIITPFLILDAEGFVKSILFSATRSASGHFRSHSFSYSMSWEGIFARLPMLLLMTGVYWCAYKRTIGMYASSLLILLIFITFNEVLYVQYMIWPTAVAFLAVIDFLPEKKAKIFNVPAKMELGILSVYVILCVSLLTYSGVSARYEYLSRSWKSEYFRNKHFKGKPVRLRDKEIDHDWKEEMPLPGFPKDEYSVRWNACLELQKDRNLLFRLTSDDGSRLFIDNNKVIDDWSDHAKRTKTAEKHMRKGKYRLRVDYYENTGKASVDLDISDKKDKKWKIKDHIRHPESCK